MHNINFSFFFVERQHVAHDCDESISHGEKINQ